MAYSFFKLNCIVCVLFVTILSVNGKNVDQYNFKTLYLDVPVDHFSFTSNATFKMRYLRNDSYYSAGGPIFFYTGNEGDINDFAQNTGFMFDIAPKFNPLIIFAEHRYYGESLPFGNLSFTSPKYLGYLSSSQAMADFIQLIDHLQKEINPNTNSTNRVPVIVFGGSYGGMLSAWIRMKYPASVDGAIAASAPIWQFKDLTPCENFNRIVTNVFNVMGTDKCSNIIKNSWSKLRSFAKNDDGRKKLSNTFKLCTPLNITEANNINVFVDWLTEIYINLVMVNYPYETSFLMPLPAYPVKEFCKNLTSYDIKTDQDLFNALAASVEIYTNYTQKTKCNSITQTSPKLGEEGWYFQSCTEMVMPMCSTDLDMFENAPFDFKQYSDGCFKKFGVRPASMDVPILEYGGKDLKSYSNIVFSNGLMDPWSSGGVLGNIPPSIYAVIIPDGAHHSDLRAAHPKDSKDVVQARNFHISMIKKWLGEFYNRQYRL